MTGFFGAGGMGGNVERDMPGEAKVGEVETTAGPWALDTSTGSEILVKGGCSVIEGEDARYLLRLIAADTSTPAPDAVARLVEAHMPRAWVDVMGERVRQMAVEGWTPEHDDAHDGAEMAHAAASYTICATEQWESQSPVPFAWPWDEAWWKPTTPRRDLVKAGALILAEIERLDRAAAMEADHD